MLRAPVGHLALWAYAIVALGCGPPSESKVGTCDVCQPAKELPDAVDPKTGLAPVPRHVAAGERGPSGPIFWRQMTPAVIPHARKARSVVVGEEIACAVVESGESVCWVLPFDRFKYFPEDRTALDLVESIPPPSTPLAPPAEVPEEVRRQFPHLPGVEQISGDAALACARLNTGAVHCASAKPPGPVPSASDFPSVPTLVEGLEATSLSVHGAACAVTTQGDVVCWGHIARTAMFPACEPVKCEPAK